MKQEFLNDFCRDVLKIDKAIRFAGVADKFGKMVVAEYRTQLTPLLTKEETQLSIIQSSIRMGSRKLDQPKLGKVVYAFTLYEKVKRAAIPLSNYSTLLLSFDVEVDHEPIILKKIIPYAKKQGLKD